MEDYGWQRPDAYPSGAETLAGATAREVLQVRRAVGVFDNSPIGKIEVRGADAARFLDRVYINDIGGMRVGQARYGLLMNENGVLLDDGIVMRLAEQHFLLNTGSAHAAAITRWLEQCLQVEWPQLQVVVDEVTADWACFTVAGPRARDVLSALEPGLDIAPGALPHMHCATTTLAGLPARIARVSFSGELSYEISVAAGHGAGLLEAIGAQGAGHGLVPYGIEALMMLRLEKGYFHVGTDTDGASTPDDVGWGVVARRKGGELIGRRSLERSANLSAQRRQLVGIEPLDDADGLPIGAHFPAAERGRTDGWITSAGYSPTLQRWIGLALLANGRARTGEQVGVLANGQTTRVRVTQPCFYDPRGERLHG
jgi:sarcosine oxidase subunit alpha